MSRDDSRSALIRYDSTPFLDGMGSRRMAEYLLGQLEARAEADWSKRRTFALEIAYHNGEAQVGYVIDNLTSRLDGMAYVRMAEHEYCRGAGRPVLVDIRQPEHASVFLDVARDDRLVRDLREVEVEPLQGA